MHRIQNVVLRTSAIIETLSETRALKEMKRRPDIPANALHVIAISEANRCSLFDPHAEFAVLVIPRFVGRRHTQLSRDTTSTREQGQDESEDG